MHHPHPTEIAIYENDAGDRRRVFLLTVFSMVARPSIVYFGFVTLTKNLPFTNRLSITPGGHFYHLNYFGVRERFA